MPGLRGENAAEIAVSSSFPTVIDNQGTKGADDNGLSKPRQDTQNTQCRTALMKGRAVPVVGFACCLRQARDQPSIPQYPMSAASRSEHEQSGKLKFGGCDRRQHCAPPSAGGPRLGEG